MRPNLVPICILSTLLMSDATAQEPSTVAPTLPAASEQSAGFAGPLVAPGPIHFLPRRNPWVVRASDLLGERIYNPNGEDVGEVEDVLINRNGRIEALVIEVGGFLGIGERRIAVSPRAVRLDPHEMTATSGTVPSVGLSPETQGAARARNDHRVSKAIVPERMVLTLSVDQLRSAPAYVDE
ncbi:PRC-barrel domain-containing protein [Microvirga arabica]|uniref:PRC-barrel domain-containing protein n=1 Tax=Microvirga arabica TaxID=1128671 RepID=UPI001939630B|nr:PRC-barrel domain-containing protein [Microvirga arabica]MBM1170055.1 PRC-barrel domain-containing protein [Microvirga arabica]